MSVPGAQGKKGDRAVKALSTTSLDPEVTAGAQKSRPPLQPLDEVVMGTPILSHSLPDRSIHYSDSGSNNANAS